MTPIGTWLYGSLILDTLECGMASHCGSHNLEGVTAGAGARRMIPDVGISCLWVWRYGWLHVDSQKGLMPEGPQ